MKLRDVESKDRVLIWLCFVARLSAHTHKVLSLQQREVFSHNIQIIIMEEMQKKLQTEADTLRQIHKGKEMFDFFKKVS